MTWPSIIVNLFSRIEVGKFTREWGAAPMGLQHAAAVMHKASWPGKGCWPKAWSLTLQRTSHGQRLYILFKKMIWWTVYCIASGAVKRDCPMHVEI